MAIEQAYDTKTYQDEQGKPRAGLGVVVLNPNDISGGGGGGSDYEIVVTTYVVKTAFAGASIGDTVTCSQIIHVTGNPHTSEVVWRNQTTGVDFGTVPSAANLELLGSQALTNAQLRATPVAMQPSYAASEKTAVTGTFTAIGNSAVFTPIAGRAFNITISGGSAVINVTRSFDNGSTWRVVMPDSMRTGLPESLVMDAEPETGVQYRIECTAYTSGTVAYRISQ